LRGPLLIVFLARIASAVHGSSANSTTPRSPRRSTRVRWAQLRLRNAAPASAGLKPDQPTCPPHTDSQLCPRHPGQAPIQRSISTRAYPRPAGPLARTPRGLPRAASAPRAPMDFARTHRNRKRSAWLNQPNRLEQKSPDSGVRLECVATVKGGSCS
jgi:hypothetical protein